MKKIVFDGHLRDMYPEGICVEGDSPAECLSALANFPGFREEDGVRHDVILPDYLSRDALYARTDREVIRVSSIVAGAGGKLGQFLQIAIGVLLVVVGTITGIPQLVSLGVMMILQGVVGLLMPQPEIQKAGGTEEKSSYLSGTKNTVRIGTRIPLIYGRRKVFGHYLSFNVTATNMPQPGAPSETPDGGFSSTTDSEYVWTDSM